MIAQFVKDNILKNITGLSRATARGDYYSAATYSSLTLPTYIGLASEITTYDGNVSAAIEPNTDVTQGKADTGYKRFRISDGNSSNSAVQLKDGVVINQDTLYFDEAIADYDVEPKYYFLAGTATGGYNQIYAWGEIVDEYGNPTTLKVKKNSLPIMRKSQLKISLTETEKPKYTLTLNYDGTEESIANLYCIPGLATQYTKDDIIYDIEGWYYDADFTESSRVGEPGANNQIALTKDTTIYAKLSQRNA